MNTLMEHVNNYANYRASLKTVKLPALPYLGVYLRDIVFLDQGNPDYFGENNVTINFEKLQLLGTTFCDVKKFQKIAYHYQIHEPLRDFLLRLPVLPEEMLYKHSLLCENNPGPDV